jgi:hypothetical protein
MGSGAAQADTATRAARAVMARANDMGGLFWASRSFNLARKDSAVQNF